MKGLGVRRWGLRGNSPAQTLDVLQGEGGLAQAECPRREAVTIGAARDEQAVFRGQPREEENIVRTVRRVENFDPLKPCVDKMGEAVQGAMVRMGQDGDPGGVSDGRDGLRGTESCPLHIGWPALAKEAVEGLVYIADGPPRDESPGHVGSADGPLSGDLKNLLLGQGNSQSVEAAEDFIQPIPAPGRQQIESRLKGHIVPMDEVAKDMHFLAHFMDGKLDTWNDLHGLLRTGLECFGDSGDRVMVSEGNGVDVEASRVGDDLPRHEGSVRKAGMQVKVSSPCHRRHLPADSEMGQSVAFLTIRSTVGAGQAQDREFVVWHSECSPEGEMRGRGNRGA